MKKKLKFCKYFLEMSLVLFGISILIANTSEALDGVDLDSVEGEVLQQNRSPALVGGVVLEESVQALPIEGTESVERVISEPQRD